jgi:hypothetical protein
MNETILLVVPDEYSEHVDNGFKDLLDGDFSINNVESTVEPGRPADEHDRPLEFQVATVSQARKRGITTGDGLYLRRRDGTWQILGHSVNFQGLQDIIHEAYAKSYAFAT